MSRGQHHRPIRSTDTTIAYLVAAVVALLALGAWFSTESPPEKAPAVHLEERTPVARSLPPPDPANVHPIEDLSERWPSAPSYPCPSVSPIMAVDTRGCNR